MTEEIPMPIQRHYHQMGQNRLMYTCCMIIFPSHSTPYLLLILTESLNTQSRTKSPGGSWYSYFKYTTISASNSASTHDS
jgi:hypothetical protein